MAMFDPKPNREGKKKIQMMILATKNFSINISSVESPALKIQGYPTKTKDPLTQTPPPPKKKSFFARDPWQRGTQFRRF